MAELPHPPAPEARIPVTHVIGELPVGGAERALLRLVSGLAPYVRPRVVTLREKGELAAECQRDGIPVELVRMKSRWSPASLCRLARALKGQHIVQTHMYRANVSGTIAAWLARVPVVINTVQNIASGHWDNERQRKTEARLKHFREAVVCVSEAVRHDYLRGTGEAPQRVVVIYNGVEPLVEDPCPDRAAARAEFGFSAEHLVILNAARLHPNKDQKTLLLAAQKVVAAVPQARFLIAGEGGLFAELLALRQELALAEQVVFAGLRHDVPRLMALADVFCLSSIKEGFPQALGEAMRAGLPLVVTDAGGNREGIIAGENGFLVPPADPKILAERLIHVLSDAALRQKLAAGSAASFTGFTRQEMVRRTLSLYAALLEGKGLRVPWKSCFPSQGASVQGR